DDLELGVNGNIENLGKLIGVRGWARSADRQLVLHDLLERGDAGRMPGDAHADFVVHAADPIELGRVELGLRRAKQRIESSTAPDRTECRAIPGRDVIEPVGEDEAAGARHILRHDGGIARDEARHMAGQRASVDVISATGAVADVKIDRLALVKVRPALRVTERDRTEGEDRRSADQCQDTHVILPLPQSQITSPRRDFDSKLGDEPDRAGATLGRTATATILPGDPAFAIDTMKTRAGESNVDEATQHSRGAVRDLLLPGCGGPRS